MFSVAATSVATFFRDLSKSECSLGFHWTEWERHKKKKLTSFFRNSEKRTEENKKRENRKIVNPGNISPKVGSQQKATIIFFVVARSTAA